MMLWVLAAITLYLVFAIYTIWSKHRRWKRIQNITSQESIQARALLSQLDQQDLTPIAISYARSLFPSFAISRLRTKLPGISNGEAMNLLALITHESRRA